MPYPDQLVPPGTKPPHSPQQDKKRPGAEKLSAPGRDGSEKNHVPAVPVGSGEAVSAGSALSVGGAESVGAAEASSSASSAS